MKKKVILVLWRVNFCFQNTWQSNDCIFWITCVGSWTKRLDFSKDLFKINISLISFQQLDLNRHNFWNARFDSRTRKIIEHRRTSIEYVKSLIEMTLTLLDTPWKVEQLGGNTVDPEKEKQAVFRSAMRQWKMIKWWISELKTMVFKER
jgi:hypothetical protein